MSGISCRAEDIVLLLRVQRHDFLNQLQVISGLLQLHKLDRALEYTWETIRTLTTNGNLLALSSADLALGLMLEGQRATEQQVAVTMEVSPLADRTLPGISLSALSAVYATWNMIVGELSLLPVGGRLMKARVVENADYFAIQFSTPLAKETVEALCERLRQSGDLANLTEVTYCVSPAEDGWELVVALDRACAYS